MKKVLVFTYLHRHLKKMIPIIKEFEKNGNISLDVLVMTKEEEALALEYNINFRRLDEFTEAKRSQDFDLAWGLEPLIKAIDTIKPDLFLAIEVNYILRNAIRYCKQLGIPNIIVQHGTPNIFSLHAFAPFEGDCFAAWGDFTKEFLVTNGVDDGKIVVTGGVPFERTLSLAPDRIKIAEELGLSPDKKWIVFTTQGVGPGNCPSENDIFIGVTEIAKAAREFKDHQLIFQVHPSQRIEDIENILKNVEEHYSIAIKYRDTEELMAASEYVITFFSTTAIDAVILNKPLLLINLAKSKEFLPFVQMGAAFGAYAKEEITVKLRMLLTKSDILKPHYKKAADYVNKYNDGKALERIIELCNSKLYSK